MEAREPVCLNVLGAAGVGLQVRFAWRADRHAHTISLLVQDRTLPVLESIEGSNIDDWPPSPPLQQLSVEELRPRTQVALLVGMAGKSHWSMSVEPDSDRGAFVFDVACRSRGEVERMGSGYVLLADRLITDGDHEAMVELAGRTIQMRGDRSGVAATSVTVDSSGARLEPTAMNSGGTTRWRYTIELR